MYKGAELDPSSAIARTACWVFAGRPASVYARIDEWGNRPIAGEYPYLLVDGI